ncbi:MAG: hypothetical protein IPK15_12175 [Verrucomicrobia bacterium]|nr:hypothetical protein [Verrucomicrobiota bacterium]
MNEVAVSPDALARFRTAASEFARSAKPKASRLLSVRDDIAALRAKGASFRTISELLRRCGIAACDTCVMRFCQRVLGEAPQRALRAKARTASAKRNGAASNTGHRANKPDSPAAHPLPSEAAQIALLDDLLSYQPESQAKPPTQIGPRIAKIEFANPENHEPTN